MLGEEVETEEEKLKRFNLSSFNHTFDNFEHVPGTQKAFDVFNNLAVGKSDRKFVLCYGDPGCGKTHLIEATIIKWAEQGIMSRYNTMSQIVRRLKSALHSPNDSAYDVMFKAICDWKRLIIDDYGMGMQETKFEVSELEDIINERYHKRYYDDGKVTILVSNKDINTLPDRVTSRFYDPEFGVVVHMSSKDYRRRRVV